MAEVIGAIVLTAVDAAAGTTLAATTFSIFGATISASAIVGTAVILGASIGLQYALRPDVPRAQDGSQPLKQGIPPRIMGYGRNRLAGYYMLFEEFTGYSCDVMAFHSGRIGGVVKYYLNDDDITLSGNTVNEQPDGRYGPGMIDIQARLGTDAQTSFSFPAGIGADAIWTTDHRGQGIAAIAMTCASVEAEDFGKRYPRALPVVSVVADCAVVWDPRAVEQSRANPATWTTSYNPVVNLLDYLTREDGGVGLDYETVIEPVLADWIAEANLCDEAIARADGSVEPRYRCHGWFTFDSKPEDVINSMLATCDGWMCEDGDGTIAIKVGVYREPTVTIKANHILGFSLNYGQADEQTVNQLDISFVDPEQKYVEVQTETLRNEDAISLDGVVRAQQLNLKWVQSNSQARRLASRAMQRLGSELSGSFVTSLAGLSALGERWVHVQYPYVSGLQDCVVEVEGVELDLMAGRISWNFIRIAPDEIEAYDPETDEGEPPVVPPTPTASILPIPEGVVAVILGDATSGYSIGLTFAQPAWTGLTYVVRYRPTDGSPWITQNISSVTASGGYVSIQTNLVPGGAEYEVQVASVALSSRSDWSDETFTTSTPSPTLRREDGRAYRREDGTLLLRE